MRGTVLCNTANQTPTKQEMDTEAQTRSNEQFDEVTQECVKLFERKQRDYGLSWRILRLSSMTDQIYAKALRVRRIQEAGTQMVQDSVEGEFVGMVNYASLALMILRGQAGKALSAEKALELHKKNIAEARELFQAKNHDYGEAWREFRISSLVDFILTKILRLKQIEDNDGKTEVSEGRDSIYLDILNYAVFCLIRMRE